MGRLKQWYFYYGAIITSILENNPDASPTLLVNEESKQVYRIKTTNLNEEYILYLKHASCKQGREQSYSSWVFNFTDDDKERLKKYHNENEGVLIYLLCLKGNIQDSEIVVLKYDEYKQVKNKNTITIGAEKGKKTFFLFTGESKARSDALLIKRNRNEYRFHKLLEDEAYSRGVESRKIQKKDADMKSDSNKDKGSTMCYENAMVCPICGEGKLYLSKSNGSIFPFTGKKCNKCDAIFFLFLDYMRILKEYGGIPLKDNVRIMNWHNDIHERNYVNEKKIKAENARTIDNSNLIHTLPYDDNMCPIHNKKMNIKTLNFGMHIKDTVYYCDRCNKMYIEKGRKENLDALLKSKRIISKYKIV